jgi:hypothetical protein
MSMVAPSVWAIIAARHWVNLAIVSPWHGMQRAIFTRALAVILKLAVVGVVQPSA